VFIAAASKHRERLHASFGHAKDIRAIHPEQRLEYLVVAFAQPA
jgi:hypothetical protein